MIKIYNEANWVTFMFMDDETVDLTVTSPPYDNLRKYTGYSFDFEATARELYRVTKRGGVVVWVVADQTHKGSESGTSFRQALYFKEIGFNLADTMIYYKSDLAFPKYGHKKYPAAWEFMFVLSKGPVSTCNLIYDRANKKAGSVMSGTVRQVDGSLSPSRAKGRLVAEVGCRSNVWGYSTGKGKSASSDIAFKHPAIFPEKLAQDHVITWSNPGAVVFDPFMGSGTTGLAAAKLGRSFIGCEISTEYYNISKDRLSQYL